MLEEHARGELPSFAHKQHVNPPVGEIHSGVRLEAANRYLLVVIGATPEATKELVAPEGFRGSEQSCKKALLAADRPGDRCTE